jgi:hypothetical protein
MIHKHSTLPLAFALLIWQPAEAIILFGLNNSANQTDPGTGAHFASVALISDAGMTNPQGSAIHLGNGYMLTANHVGMQPYVTFDGSTYYERDLSYIPTQVAANVDMKIFKLTAEPTVGAVNLYDGSSEQISDATQVGWGLGRDTTVPVDSATVAWGDNSTIAKRWGLNVPRGLAMVNYQAGSYTAMFTVLGSDAGNPAGLGDNEAAATTYDSGSALFQNLGGVWYLIGLTTAVETLGSSTFGNDQFNDPNGHRNYFVRVSAYHSEIVALIPEPSSCGLLAGGLFLLVICRRGARH